MDLTDELRKLADLKKEGLLDEQEFIEAKRSLLNGNKASAPATPSVEQASPPPMPPRPIEELSATPTEEQPPPLTQTPVVESEVEEWGDTYPLQNTRIPHLDPPEPEPEPYDVSEMRVHIKIIRRLILTSLLGGLVLTLGIGTFTFHWSMVIYAAFLILPLFSMVLKSIAPVNKDGNAITFSGSSADSTLRRCYSELTEGKLDEELFDRALTKAHGNPKIAREVYARTRFLQEVRYSPKMNDSDSDIYLTSLGVLFFGGTGVVYLINRVFEDVRILGIILVCSLVFSIILGFSRAQLMPLLRRKLFQIRND